MLLALLGALRAFGPQGQLPQALWRDFGRTASGKIRPDCSPHFFEKFGPSGGVPGICGNFRRTLDFAGDWLCRDFCSSFFPPLASAAFGPIFFDFLGAQGGPRELRNFRANL